MRFPEDTDLDDFNHTIPVNLVSVNMVTDEDQQFLGDGDDTLDIIKGDFTDVLCSSLGEAAGCMRGPKMKIELDDTKPFKPCHVTTARQIPAHREKMAKALMEELEQNGAAYGFFGRHPRTTVPDIRDPSLSFTPDFAVARGNTHEKSEGAFSGHSLAPLQPGDRVHVQDTISKTWTIDGKIIRLRPSGRSYDVETPGGTFARNRRFLGLASDVSDGNIFEDEPGLPNVVVEPVVLRRSARIAGQNVSFANSIQVWFQFACLG